MDSCDKGRLGFEELLELRELQTKMVQTTGSIEGYSALTLDELLRLEDLHYKMAGRENPHKPASPHVTVIASRDTAPDSSGVAAAVERQPVASGLPEEPR